MKTVVFFNYGVHSDGLIILQYGKENTTYPRINIYANQHYHLFKLYTDGLFPFLTPDAVKFLNEHIKAKTLNELNTVIMVLSCRCKYCLSCDYRTNISRKH